MKYDFPTLSKDDTPRQTVIAFFECDKAGMKPDQDTINS